MFVIIGSAVGRKAFSLNVTEYGEFSAPAVRLFPQQGK